MIVQLLSGVVKAGVVLYTARVLRHALNRTRQRRAPALLSAATARSSGDADGHVIIVSTAAIPWRTGTAVNPTLRAAFLAAHTTYKVTLVVPFIPPQDQSLIFPDPRSICTSREQQAAVIRQWVAEHSGLGEPAFEILFYSARYYPASRCIFATEDIPKLLPPSSRSAVVLLEEPEHLNWYRSSGRWSCEFQHVVGVLHTDYSGYAAGLPGWGINQVAVGVVCRVVTRLHTHKVIQLSELAKHLARSTTCNVHGVSAKFLAVGMATSALLLQQQSQPGTSCSTAAPAACFSKGCYFLGKALWDKGHAHLMDLLQHHARKHGQQVAVDVFGSGPDLPGIQTEAARRGLDLMQFKGHADHCSPELQQYKVFVNPCRKDVLATATAEAVAMNKWVLLPDARCNQFFRAFPNVLLFSSPAEFSQHLMTALEQAPPPLSADHIRELSWTAATERLLAAASISSWPGAASQALDDCLWVPWQLFALLFRGARRVFSSPPKLLAECGQQLGCHEPGQEQQAQQQLLC